VERNFVEVFGGFSEVKPGFVEVIAEKIEV